jgi:hypothetical protein
MLLVHIFLGYAIFALAYASSASRISQSKPKSDPKSEEVKPTQTLNQRLCNADKSVSLKHLEALDAISKTFPSPIDDISTLLLTYTQAGANGRWNTTMKHTKALLDNLANITAQDDAHVSDLDGKIKLQDLSTTFLDLLPLTIPTQGHSGAIETNPVNPNATPNSFNGTLSDIAMAFLHIRGLSLSIIPATVLLTLSLIHTPPNLTRYDAEAAKYKIELELLRNSYLKTSKPLPFSKELCQEGVLNVLSELSRNPGEVVTHMGVATLLGLVTTILALSGGMIMMMFDSGIESVLAWTHREIREWAVLMNGDSTNCMHFPPLTDSPVSLKWVEVAKVEDEVARDPSLFISDALSFAGGFDLMKAMYHVEKAGGMNQPFPSRWMDFIVGLPSALELEYRQEGPERFLDTISSGVTESIKMSCSLRDK